MKEELFAICQRFAAGRDLIKQTFRLESSYLYPICANLFCARGADADRQTLERCDHLLKEKTSVFSNFRGNLRLPVVCMLAASGYPDVQMDRALHNYSILKEYFSGSSFVALAAFLLTDLGYVNHDLASRARTIYKRIAKEHPFLTSAEDSVLAAFMAYAPQPDDTLLQDMEDCYSVLRMRFSDANAIQSATHVLCLGPGQAGDKASRMIRIFDAIRETGRKYGKNYELSTLAALSILDAEIPELVSDLMDADLYLSELKGYGGLGIDKKTRLMHAAMLVSDLYAGRHEPLTVNENTILQNTAMTGTLAMIAAQQAAACASVCTVTASAH